MSDVKRKSFFFHHQIYPRVGDIVARVTEKNGEQKMYRVRIKSIPKTAAIGVDKVCLVTRTLQALSQLMYSTLYL